LKKKLKKQGNSKIVKVVIDTNVLVSGLLTPNGNSAKIISLLLNEKNKILYDNRILEEYKEVLSRDRFGFNYEYIDALIEFIKQDGIFILAEPIADRFKDENDKKFLEVARSGDAKYLITGNKAHFPEEKIIVNPTGFLESL
jgi:putative PIN family toxin of toxin-antitoxin system